MSHPYSPNQQPLPGAGNGMGGQYPGAGQYGSSYGEQPTQEMPAAGGMDGYGPQPTQQMPAAGGVGGYGQAQPGYGPQQPGYGPQQPGYAQQGYPGGPGAYPQGQGYPGGPYGSFGGQPPKKGAKKGLIIGIVASVATIVLVAVLAVVLTQKGSDAPDPSASPTPSSSPTSAPSATSDPSAAPSKDPSAAPGKNPSAAPSASQGSSGELSADEEYGVKHECKAALAQSVTEGRLENLSIERDGTDTDGNPQYLYKGQFNGTILSGRKGVFNFTCTAVYHKSEGAFEAWASLDTN